MKLLLKIVGILAIFYVLLCVLLYFQQEKLLFFPEKLNANHSFHFQLDFQEVVLKTKDNTKLHTIHFKTEKPQGVIFFLHGNGGSLDRWGNVANVYTKLGGYDCFIMDYRGYGKSEGNIESLKQIYDDVQLGYNWLKDKYSENDISVFGYSLGTGLATKVAANNQPKRLVLHAPYYSIENMMQKQFPVIPTFLLRYNINTAKFMENVDVPTYIFHGNQDNVIPIEQSEKLKTKSPQIQLFELESQDHNNMVENLDYQMKLAQIMLDLARKC